MKNNCLLIYPPFASPACPPFHLIEIAGYIKKQFGLNLDILDLNIQSFRILFGNDVRLQIVKSSESFFDINQYMPAVYSLFLDWLNKGQELMPLFENYIKNNTDSFDEWISRQDIPVLDNYQAFGLSLTYHQADDSSQFFATMAIAKWLKSSYPEKPIVLGGALLNHLDPKDILLTFPFIDAIFLKESEESFGQWLNEPALSFIDIPNIVYCDKKNIVSNVFEDNIKRGLIYSIPIEKLSLTKYLTPEPVITFQLRRGCYWNRCHFCSGNLSYFGYESINKLDVFEKKMESLQAAGIYSIYLSDQMISASDANAIADIFEKRKWTISWSFMAMPNPSFSKELLIHLSKNGCKWITWGVESGSERILKKMNKPLKVSTVRINIKESHSAGIHNILLMMYGFPGETKEDLVKSFNLLLDLKPYYYSFSFGGYHLNYGSAICKTPEVFGLNKKEPLKIFVDEHNSIKSNLYSYTPLYNYNFKLPDKLKLPKQIPLSEHFLLYAGHFKKIPK